MPKETSARKKDKKNFSHAMSFVKFMAAALKMALTLSPSVPFSRMRSKRCRHEVPIFVIHQNYR